MKPMHIETVQEYLNLLEVLPMIRDYKTHEVAQERINEIEKQFNIICLNGLLMDKDSDN